MSRAESFALHSYCHKGFQPQSSSATSACGSSTISSSRWLSVIDELFYAIAMFLRPSQDLSQLLLVCSLFNKVFDSDNLWLLYWFHAEHRIPLRKCTLLEARAAFVHAAQHSLFGFSHAVPLADLSFLPCVKCHYAAFVHPWERLISRFLSNPKHRCLSRDVGFVSSPTSNPNSPANRSLTPTGSSSSLSSASSPSSSSSSSSSFLSPSPSFGIPSSPSSRPSSPSSRPRRPASFYHMSSEFLHIGNEQRFVTVAKDASANIYLRAMCLLCMLTKATRAAQQNVLAALLTEDDKTALASIVCGGGCLHSSTNLRKLIQEVVRHTSPSRALTPIALPATGTAVSPPLPLSQSITLPISFPPTSLSSSSVFSSSSTSSSSIASSLPAAAVPSNVPSVTDINSDSVTTSDAHHDEADNSERNEDWHWSFFTVAICGTCRSDLVWSSEISAWRELASLQPGLWKEYLCCPHCDVEDLIVPELELARAQVQAQQEIDAAGSFFPSIAARDISTGSNIVKLTSFHHDSEQVSIVRQPRPRMLIPSSATSGMADRADEDAADHERPLSRTSSASAHASVASAASAGVALSPTSLDQHFASNFVLETPSSAPTSATAEITAAITSTSEASPASTHPLTSVLAGPVKRKSFSKVSFSSTTDLNDS